MHKKGRIAVAVCLIIFVAWLIGCDPFSSRDVPEDISGTWGGSITEGARYNSIVLKLSHSGTLVTGSWTTAIHGVSETGGISGSYFDGKAHFTLSLGSNIVGNMDLKFDDDAATGTGTERGNEFEVTIKKL